MKQRINALIYSEYFLELRRKTTHIVFGMTVLMAYLDSWYVNVKQVFIMRCLLLLFYMLLTNKTVMHRISFSISQFFKKLLERESTHISGIGGLTLLFGCYLPIVTGSDQEIVMVIIITLSVGDGFATITGRYLGIYALSISKSRSILGTLGGLVAALIVSMVLIEDFDLWLGSAVALGIAIELCVGLLPNRISAFVARFSLDNLLIPIGMMIFCSL